LVARRAFHEELADAASKIGPPMSVQRLPCHWCGDLTFGIDAYAICAACSREVEARGVLSGRPDAAAQAPLTARENARLRKLLDDW
jgi:hypothetical protein